MYKLETDEVLYKKFSKLSKKNKKQLKIIRDKVIEILKNPHRYKNLRHDMKDYKRVHIDKHFVLVFSIDETSKTVTLEDYDHHDKIYK
ncbi:hypothetical protein GOV06_03280 [Candidatus Woesearchaeota archaeon]|nr:hypothetical protein [Candidatus Woesearchaeota archaeon]